MYFDTVNKELFRKSTSRLYRSMLPQVIWLII